MRVLACLLLVLALNACSSSAPLPSYYLLRSDITEGNRMLEAAPEFALGSLAVAPYIDQPGLLLETEHGDLRPARFHLWAEPVRDGARAFLSTEISRASGKDIMPWNLNREATRFDIRIDQLHGTYDGRAKLVAQWWLYDGEEISEIHEFAQTKALDRDGYGALAGAQKALLRDFARSIAAQMNTQN